MKSKAEKQSQKKETTGAQHFRKVVKYFVFPMICASGRSESRLAEAAGAEPCRQRRNEYFPPLWRDAHFQFKMPNTQPVRQTLQVAPSKNGTPL